MSDMETKDKAEFEKLKEAIKVMEEAAFAFHRTARSQKYRQKADMIVGHVRRISDVDEEVDAIFANMKSQ